MRLRTESAGVPSRPIRMGRGSHPMTITVCLSVMGFGQIYNGQTAKGAIVFSALWVLLPLLTLGVLMPTFGAPGLASGLALGSLLWLLAVVDGVAVSMRLNRGDAVDAWESFARRRGGAELSGETSHREPGRGGWV